MKFILIIWVCTFLHENACLKPIKYPKLFDSWYECSIAAQIESRKLIQKGGYAWVNKYEVGTKYSCVIEQSI